MNNLLYLEILDTALLSSFFNCVVLPSKHVLYGGWVFECPGNAAFVAILLSISKCIIILFPPKNFIVGLMLEADSL